MAARRRRTKRNRLAPVIDGNRCKCGMADLRRRRSIPRDVRYESGPPASAVKEEVIAAQVNVILIESIDSSGARRCVNTGGRLTTATFKGGDHGCEEVYPEGVRGSRGRS